jgi:hypothetical protein
MIIVICIPNEAFNFKYIVLKIIFLISYMYRNTVFILIMKNLNWQAANGRLFQKQMNDNGIGVAVYWNANIYKIISRNWLK